MKQPSIATIVSTADEYWGGELTDEIFRCASEIGICFIDPGCARPYSVMAERLNITHYRVQWSRDECRHVRGPDSIEVHWCQGTLHRTEGVSADCRVRFDLINT